MLVLYCAHIPLTINIILHTFLTVVGIPCNEFQNYKKIKKYEESSVSRYGMEKLYLGPAIAVKNTHVFQVYEF